MFRIIFIVYVLLYIRFTVYYNILFLIKDFDLTSDQIKSI